MKWSTVLFASVAAAAGILIADVALAGGKWLYNTVKGGQ